MQGTARARVVVFAVLAAFGSVLWAACAGGVDPALDVARAQLAEGRLEQARATLEPFREVYADDPRVRLGMGELYYRTARRELALGRDQAYRNLLIEAESEIRGALALDPGLAEAHTWLGILAVYRRDLEHARASLLRARRLEPSAPAHVANLAELAVYRGELDDAETLLGRARELGASEALIGLVGALAAWRGGDYAEAVERFDTARSSDPELVARWNEAPLDDPIESFGDLARFCCSHHACGPFMQSSCAELRWPVPALDDPDSEVGERSPSSAPPPDADRPPQPDGDVRDTGPS